MTWGDLTVPTLGVTGLLALVFLAVVRGWLVPKVTMDARVADFHKQIADQQDAYEGRLADKDSIIGAQRITIAEQAKQLDELVVPLAETVQRVLTALPVGRRSNG